MITKKTERQKKIDALTRQEILDAAIATLYEDGADALTMDRIAERAGVSKGTLYNHFSSKQKVLDAGIDKIFQPYIAQIEDILHGPLLPEEKLYRYAFTSFDFFVQREKLFRAIHIAKGGTYEDTRGDQDSYYWKNHRDICAILQEGTEAGTFRPMDCSKVASMIIEAIGGLVLSWFVKGHNDTPAENARALMQVLLHGIAV